MYKALIFDFDGTVCDTGEGIKKSAAFALKAFGLPYTEGEDLSFFIGPPLLNVFTEHYGVDEPTGRALIDKYRERYNVTGLYECELYGGVVETFANLKGLGIKLGIASSKPKKYIDILLEKFGITDYFSAVCGVDFSNDTEKKSNIINRCREALGEDVSETAVVGDRCFDVFGARENGIDSIGVLWGYGSEAEFLECGADFIVEKPADIEAVALGLFEQTVERDDLFDGRVIKAHCDDVKLCNKKSAKRECVDHVGGVAVIGLTDEDEVLLVRQFRYPYKEVIYEIPAGKVEKGEEPFETGKREFKEECGAIADEYFSLGEIYPSPGYTNEIIRLWGATGIHFEEQRLDDDEFLEVHRVKFDALIERIMSGEIKDAKTVAAAFKLKEKLKR